MSRLALGLALALTAFAYWPGLSGDFLFDDYVNLNALGRYGGVQDLQTLLFYLTSGIADPTGRPVAMASFLLDARDWPADPFPFKRTNLLIHLANGLLLYSVLVALGRRLSQDARRVEFSALAATTLWLMAPLWVSTTLYIVQRHAMLATLFTLAGIHAWIGSRNAFDGRQQARGWWLAILAVPVCGSLAGLSKANGFLLPVLLSILELTVLRRGVSASAPQQWARLLLAWLPASLLLGWLFWYSLQLGLDGTQGRPWTLGQRLLTQPRALYEYLGQLWIPGLGATGIFADGFAHSQDWRTPWTTQPAALLLAIAAGAAWRLRQRLPVMAAAIGFFLAGHLMESSVVMLELYFEHRNYLPSLLLFWPLCWWLATPGRFRPWLLAGALGYAGLMLMTTAVQARLWSDPLALAQVWADQNPDSARAQAHAFHEEMAAGKTREAEQRLVSHLQTMPLEPQLTLNLLDLRCGQRRVTRADVERAAAAIVASNGLALDMNYQWLSSALLPGSGAACSSLPEPELQMLRVAADDGTAAGGEQVEMHARALRLAGNFALRQRDCPGALRAFDNRVRTQPRPEFVQSQAVLLATHCSAALALAHLERYLDSGAPVHRATSPILRVRDRLMQHWWHTYWDDLHRVLESETSLEESPPPLNIGRPAHGLPSDDDGTIAPRRKTME